MSKRVGLIVLLMVVSTPVFSSDTGGRIHDPWFGFDKLKHLSSSFILTTTGYYVQTRMVALPEQQSLSNAGMLTISLGLGKELLDRRKPGGIFSYRDLVANLTGVGLAVLFIKVVI
ncbi:MAG TPA: DUF2279 domain-containing protein [Candidatus Marinimicrobia bacterium]|nr:DUF2279 domain-containing protein [Candidatus Neomarinimicrobiota bacterium]